MRCGVRGKSPRRLGSGRPRPAWGGQLADEPSQPLERPEYDGAQDDRAVRSALVDELDSRHVHGILAEVPERQIKV